MAITSAELRASKNSRFEPPFGGLYIRGNVHGSSMARWKARMVDFLLVLIEFSR